jgi:hypothetical protein
MGLTGGLSVTLGLNKGIILIPQVYGILPRFTRQNDMPPGVV